MPRPYEAPTSVPKTYVGCCYCQAIKFTVEVSRLDTVLPCNCSFCIRKQLVFVRVPHEKLKIEQQPPQMLKYAFGNKSLVVESCPTCSNTFRMIADGESSYSSINVRLLHDVDVWSVKHDPNVPDYANSKPAYQPAKYTGPDFEKDGTGDKVTYYGGCHCGAVTTAFRSEPLEKMKMVECNCSWCTRYGSSHVYPTSDQVHIGGAENLVKYYDNIYKRDGFALFCRTCSLQLLICASGPASAADGNTIEDAEKVLGHNFRLRALNVKNLYGIDYGKLDVIKYDGRSDARSDGGDYPI